MTKVTGFRLGILMKFIVDKNPQYAYEYAMYEMLTSYYNSSKSLNNTIEKRLKLYFLDYSDNKQVAMEQECEDKIEKVISRKLNFEEIAKEDVSVNFKFIPSEKRHLLIFETPQSTLKLKLKLNAGKLFLEVE